MKKKFILLLSLPLLMGCNTVDNTKIKGDENISATATSIEINQQVYTGKKVKVYLNPSVQTWNQYINNLGTEAEHMNNIAHYMYDELVAYNYIDVKANFDYLALKDSVKESNTFNADIHFAIHSNAGGGQGSEILTNKNSTSFASKMYEGFMELGNFKRRGIKDGNSLYEIKNSKAENKALIELLFHDNLLEAKYIIENEKIIAHQLVLAMTSFILNNLM